MSSVFGEGDEFRENMERVNTDGYWTHFTATRTHAGGTAVTSFADMARRATAAEALETIVVLKW